MFIKLMHLKIEGRQNIRKAVKILIFDHHGGFIAYII